MEALISFTIKTRLRQLFGGKYAWAVNGWRLLWLLFAIIYGLLFAFIFTHGKTEKVNLSSLIFGINITAFIITLLRNFFPIYQFKPPFIPSISSLSTELSCLMPSSTWFHNAEVDSLTSAKKVSSPS